MKNIAWSRVRCNGGKAIAVNTLQRHSLDCNRARRQILLRRLQSWRWGLKMDRNPVITLLQHERSDGLRLTRHTSLMPHGQSESIRERMPLARVYSWRNVARSRSTSGRASQQ